MLNRIVAFVVVATYSTAMLGCGGDGGTDAEISKPAVTETSPQDGATDVGMVPLITISFSQEMEASTLSGIAVSGIATHHVTYDTLGNRATVCISQALAGETAYEVTVPASVTGENGHSLGTDYTFGFATGPFTCDNATDYFEPNSSGDEGADIDIPCVYPVLSSCGSSTRYDYFDFTVEEAAKVTFRLQRVDGGPAVHWITTFQRHPYQICGIWDSLRTGEDVSDYYSFLPGTYTLRAGKQDDDDDIVFYSLTIETSEPCQDDIYEDNDFAFEAAPIEVGYHTGLVSCHKDLDYYAIDLTVAQTLTVTGDNVSGQIFYGGIYMRDPDYQTVAQDVGTHNPLRAFWTATVDGTYRFSVSWSVGEVEYSLNVEVE